MTVRQGEVVSSIGYWSIVDPGGTDGGRFVVVDTSPQRWRGEKAQKVWGPGTRGDCEAWAKVSAGLFAAVTGQIIP